MNYSIDDANGFAVSIFDGVQVEPIIFQPDHADGSPFANHAEAETWATEKIAELGGDPAPSVAQIALISGGVVTDIVASTAPINSALHDKVLPLPDGIVVGATWNATDGFVNP